MTGAETCARMGEAAWAEREACTGRLGDIRRNRSIRFSVWEWDEVRQAAVLHDMPVAEFVRETVLVVARSSGSAVAGSDGSFLTPLIERIFRYTWFLAVERRDAMIREGRRHEVDALVADGRALHDRLRWSASD